MVSWNPPERPNLSEDAIRKKLNSEQYWIMRQCGTEPPFANAFWNHKKPGIYVDALTGEPLFSSLDKFDSGTGWPSFSRPVNVEAINSKMDRSHGTVRTEIRSKLGDNHLGHVFEDGPAPTGLRYCVNSAALRFIPVEHLEEQGYADFLKLFGDYLRNHSKQTKQREIATFAAGCFWGVESAFSELPGVLDTRVGYTGGKIQNPTYEEVCSDTTGHAEALEITFDPEKISFEDLLRYFWKLHDPTTRNRQGPDIGSQYRSAVFFHSDAQKLKAEEIMKELDQSGMFRKPIVTQIVKAQPFYPAEDYHQRYFEKNGISRSCHHPS